MGKINAGEWKKRKEGYVLCLVEGKDWKVGEIRAKTEG